MQKAINMIDWEIDVALWLEDSLSYVKKWKGRHSYFKQFNRSFISTYNELGKYRLRNKGGKCRHISRSQIALNNINALLDVIAKEDDYSNSNLELKVQERGFKLGESNIKYYLQKLVMLGAIENVRNKTRVRELKILKKRLD